MAKYLIGIVTSDVRDKSITVTVTTRETHPLYGKQYTVSRKYQAHDKNNEAHIGDKVRIKEIRPVSKTKSFTLDKIEEKSLGSIELKEDVAPEDEAKKAREEKSATKEEEASV